MTGAMAVEGEPGGWSGWIDRYVDQLVAGGHVRTESVERALRQVPRHLCFKAFHDDRGRRVKVPHRPETAVPDDVAERVYSDAELETAVDDTGQPSMVAARPARTAVMVEALDLHGGERVLEIGAGTGYATALIAEITAAPVVSIEPDPTVARRARASLRRLGTRSATVITRNPYDGHPDGAPYDRVITNLGTKGAAEAWMDQLALDGFIVATITIGGHHRVIGLERGRPWTAQGWGIWWPASPPEPYPRQPTDEQATVVERFEDPLDDPALAALGAYLTLSGAGRVVEHPSALRLRVPGPTVVEVHRDGISVEGTASHADEIMAVIGDWRARGCPRFSDWRCELTLDQLPAGRFWWPFRWETTNAQPSTDGHPDQEQPCQP